jgi:hypothetical protein
MARIKMPSEDRLDHFSEIPNWLERVRKLHEDIRKTPGQAEIAYDGDTQSRFTELHKLIIRCGISVERTMRLAKLLRVVSPPDVGGSPEVKRPPHAEIYKKLECIREKCEIATHKFL